MLKKPGKKPVSTRKKQLPAAMEAHKWQPGVSPNPAGRPKGSRNRFAEEFLKDFLADWELHGATALAKCRTDDPAAYIRVAATLLPKDFNINMTDEANLDKLLEQFDDKQLKELLAGLVAVGAGGKKDAAPQTAGNKPDSVH